MLVNKLNWKDVLFDWHLVSIDLDNDLKSNQDWTIIQSYPLAPLPSFITGVLTWANFIPSMNNQSYAKWSMEWYYMYLSLPKRLWY